MTLTHRAYPRIETTLTQAVSNAAWVATEKLHGANFVLATDGRTFRVGKRKAWLEPDEAFFGWQLLRTELERATLELWKALGGAGPLRLHGELYGGAYPHPKVPAVPGLIPVQTGVWYAPDLRFALFDVQLESPEGPVFLAHRELEHWAPRVGLEGVPRLGQGNRAELAKLPTRFATLVPARLGLPALPDNWAEGFVLKPAETMLVAKRPAVKHKLPEFDDARFDESMPWDPSRPVSLEVFLHQAQCLLNPARLASARSKVGNTCHESLVEELVLDVLLDLERAFPKGFAMLELSAQDALQQHCLGQARKLLEAQV